MLDNLYDLHYQQHKNKCLILSQVAYKFSKEKLYHTHKPNITYLINVNYEHIYIPLLIKKMDHRI